MPLYRQALPADGLIEEIVGGIPGYKVLPAVRRQGLEPEPLALHALQSFGSVIYENVLAVDMVAGKQLP
jgi:hypothetical protein